MLFDRYVGIDYSGAMTPRVSLKGLRVYMAGRVSRPVEVKPPPSPRWYWTRREIAEWLAERLMEGERSLVGIDHGFSFPLQYFHAHQLPHDWGAFLDDFQRHWPTDGDYVNVEAVREGSVGDGAARQGHPRSRRLTEVRAGATKSVFRFDVPGSVAKSTHAGLPWLRFLRQHVGNGVHFWPFDGWEIPTDHSVVVEVYPSMWSGGFPRENRTQDQHDAYSVAEWMRQADRDGALSAFFRPELSDAERDVAMIEGWILGVR
jgi:hypothetical protein